VGCVPGPDFSWVNLGKQQKVLLRFEPSTSELKADKHHPYLKTPSAENIPAAHCSHRFGNSSCLVYKRREEVSYKRRAAVIREEKRREAVTGN